MPQDKEIFGMRWNPDRRGKKFCMPLFCVSLFHFLYFSNAVPSSCSDSYSEICGNQLQPRVRASFGRRNSRWGRLRRKKVSLGLLGRISSDERDDLMITYYFPGCHQTYRATTGRIIRASKTYRLQGFWSAMSRQMARTCTYVHSCEYK